MKIQSIKALQCLWLVAALLGAVILGLVVTLTPCPLCLLSRAMVWSLAVLTALQWVLFDFKWLFKGLSWLVRAVWVMGVTLNGYHIGLQMQATHQTTCLPSAWAPLTQSGWWQMLESTGHPSCQIIDWQWYGVTLPMLLMGVYAVFALLEGWSYQLNRKAVT